MPDYLKYYDLERYLFEDVYRRFHAEHYIEAFDLFSIVIWKANRSKSIIANNLLKRDPTGTQDLDTIARIMTNSLYDAPTPKERMQILTDDWGFGLPTASAILTVLWPDEFTVYDTRVCGILGDYHQVLDRRPFEKLWQGYDEFKAKVLEVAPTELSLRDKDRYLWSQSAYNGLKKDIMNKFRKENKAIRSGK